MALLVLIAASIGTWVGPGYRCHQQGGGRAVPSSLIFHCRGIVVWLSRQEYDLSQGESGKNRSRGAPQAGWLAQRSDSATIRYPRTYPTGLLTRQRSSDSKALLISAVGSPPVVLHAPLASLPCQTGDRPPDPLPPRPLEIPFPRLGTNRVSILEPLTGPIFRV